MTAEHAPSSTPYETAPPDHPLFLLQADIAAQRDVPIDLHMEAFPKRSPSPLIGTSILCPIRRNPARTSLRSSAFPRTIRVPKSSGPTPAGTIPATARRS
jgi:hypothetical protein